MANGGKITYDIGFNVDKGGLKDLENTFKDFSKLSATDIMKLNPALSMKEAKSALAKLQPSIAEIQKAYSNAFDSKIGVLNIEKMQSSLKKLDLNTIQKNFAAIGPKGSEAFLKIAQSALTANIRFKETNSLVNKMGTTLINTLKWTFSSSLINRFTGAVQQAVGYVEHLDRSLNDIRIVTKKSADEMEQFGQQANKAAQALGKATTDYTEAALIYYQQGLSDEEVKARAETTLKAANVTGQATKTVSEQLTSVWNGFRVNAEQTEEYVDKLAAVAAMSASNLEELSTGMSKVASAASNLGVDIDQLTAQISTIVSVTRQAPESVGTALKTIYARISDLKLGESDEDGLGLGDVSGGLKKLGIEVLDSEGELRDLGTVIEEVAGKWNTWTSAQQAAIAQLMAGKRQYNNLVALFNNWDMYENAINTSRNATGELQKQQDIYMESTEAHIQQLKTQWEDLYDSVIDPDAIIGVTNALNGILTVITKIIDAVGGGSTLITGLLGTVLNKFGPQITQQVLMPLINNLKAARQNAAAFAQVMANTQYIASQNGFGHEATQAMLDMNRKLLPLWKSMTIEEQNESQELVRQIGYWKEKISQIDKATASSNKFLQTLADSKVKRIGQIGFSDESISNADKKYAIQYLQQQQKKVEELRKSYNNLNKIKNEGTKIDTKSGTALNFKSIKEANKALGTMRKELISLNKVGLIDDATYNKNINSLNKISQRIKDIKNEGTGTKKNYIFSSTEITELERVFTTLGRVDEQLQYHLNILRTGKKDSEQYAKSLAYVTKALDMEGKQTKQTAQNIIQTIGAVTQLVSTVQSITNIMQTMGDSTVDTGEKIKSLLSSLIYMVPMLATSIVTLSKTLEIAAPIVAGIAIGITSIAGAISFASSIGSSTRKEAAANAKNLADASAEVAQAAREEKDAIDELKTSYDALDQTSITYRDDLRKLLIDHGEFAKATKVATSSLEELDEMMKQVQEDANNKVIDTSAEQIERLKNAISTDINANVLSGSERDFENGVDTIDLGSSSDTDSIAQILKENGIDVVTDSGHINLQQFVNAMVENEAELRKALQENGSAAARRLLEIMGAEQEMLSTTAEALTAQREAKLSNIENSIDIKSNGTFEQYDAAFEELKEQAKSIFNDDEKAEEWAKKRIAESGAVGTAYAGLTDEVKGIVKGLNKQLTAEQLNYLNDHIDIYRAYGEKDAQAFLDGAQALIDGQVKSSLLIPVTIGLSKDEFKDEDITALFANGPLGDLTEGEFKLFDAQKQKRELRKYFDELIEEQENYNKEIIINQLNNLESQRSNLEKNYTLIDNLIKKYGDKINKDSLHSYEDQGYLDVLQSNLDKANKELNKNRENQRAIITSLDYSEEMKQRSLIPYKQEEEALVKQVNLYHSKLQFAKDIQKLELDQSAEDIVNQYESTAKEIDKEIANIAANSKELAASVQDIGDLEKLYKVGKITDTDYAERYMQLDRARDIEGLDTEQLENYTKYIQEIADSSDELADSLKEDGDAADKVAKSIMKMNKGVEELSSNFENWSDMLQHSNKDSQEYLDALSGMRKAISQLLDISEDYVSSNFLNENLELIGKAAEGDAEAIDNLRAALAKDVIMNLKLNDESFRDDLLSKVQSWQAELDSRSLEVGATFDDASMIAAMNKMIADVGLTVDQVNALFDSMGFEANFAEQDTTLQGFTTLTTKHHTTTDKVRDPETGQWSWTETEWVEQEPIKSETGVPAFALTTDGSAPKINSITKKATGSMNNASGRNAGGKKSSGSGGGGGGKNPSQEKPIERDTDIYRVINQELSQIESTLGRIDTIASHEWGADYRDTLKEQNKLLDKQLEKQKEKNKLQKGDLSNRRKQLEQEGVTFSEDGSVMTNAEQVLNQLYAGYNVMVGKYNEMSASDQELYKAQMDTEKNRIDAIEKKIDKYESTYSDFQSTLDDILDTHYKIIENEVNQFNNEIEIKLELSNARKEWNEFWAEIVEDVDDNDFGKKIALDMQNLDVLLGLGGNDKGTVGALTKHLKNIVSEVNKQIASADEGGSLSMFGDDTNASHEALQKYISELMTAVKDSEAAIDDIADNYLNTLDSAQDKIDKQLDGWEAIGKQINHDVDLIKLLTPDNNYDALDKQYQKQYELNQKTLKTQRMSKEFWAEQMKINKASMEQFTEGSKEWKAAEKAYEKSVENFKKANDTLNEGIEKSLEDLQTLIENLNDQAIYKLDKALSGGLGLDLMEEEWKLINDEANKYYDNVERYINMEDYTNVLNEAANAVGLSAANQQKLNDFRDQELKQLSERNKLTSYDIEESKARLEILKAQMALEDVQRNKSNMRLRRDSQGNYNYQYTANEDQVDEADNRLLTAKRSWYEIVKKRYQETTEDIINLLKQQTDLATKIKDAEAAGDEARLAKYTELYKANEEAITEAYNQAEKNKRDMYTGTAQYFANVVDRNMLEQSKTTARELVDTWASGGKESVTGAISEAYTTLEKNQEDFVKKTDVLLTAAKVNYENLRKEGIDPTVDSLEDLVESNEKLDEELTNINDALSQQIIDLANAAKAYEDLKKSAVSALEDANKAMETLSETVVKSQEDIRASIKATQEQVNSIGYDTVAPSSSSSSSSGTTGTGGVGSIGSSTPKKETGFLLTVTDDKGGHYTATYGTKSQLIAEALKKSQQNYKVTLLNKETNKVLVVDKNDYYIAREAKIKAFKSGGYTGSWGSEGKLAMLHEKELVLNASDTRNILSAVELLRALPFSALAQSIVDSSSNIAASFRSGINMNGIGGGTTNNETKSMVVNADFSGVRSADEIYQALIELENYGLQNSYSVAPHANTAY